MRLFATGENRERNRFLSLIPARVCTPDNLLATFILLLLFILLLWLPRGSFGEKKAEFLGVKLCNCSAAGGCGGDASLHTTPQQVSLSIRSDFLPPTLTPGPQIHLWASSVRCFIYQSCLLVWLQVIHPWLCMCWRVESISRALVLQET